MNLGCAIILAGSSGLGGVRCGDQLRVVGARLKSFSRGVRVVPFSTRGNRNTSGVHRVVSRVTWSFGDIVGDSLEV